MTYEVHNLEGRPHYVVPVVMLRVGTFAGSQGPIHYPAAPLRRSVPAWNGRPVIVYHPLLLGTPATALHPDVFSRQKVGVLFNAALDGDRLTARAWIDAGRVGLVDPRVLDAIVQGRPLDVSTGLLVEDDGETVVDGYGRAARVAARLFPDHLAVLPDGPGACSVEAGCGLLVAPAGGYGGVPAGAW
ncbi:MAG TPA: hypothetical protein VGF55_02045 [Gemmataceae bacterium]|jgi:hypothetical protein